MILILWLDDKLPVDNTFKNNLISITWGLKVDNQFYLQILFGEVLLDE